MTIGRASGIGLIGLGLLLFGVAAKPAPPAPAPEPQMRVHFLNVGQGAATLVEFPCGAMLIDTGGEEDSEFHSVEVLTAYLDAFFARRTDLKNTLDVLLLTHPHIDHVRGVPAVIERYTVARVVDDGRSPMQDDAVLAISRLKTFLVDHPDVAHTVVSLADFDGEAPLTSATLDPFPACKGVDPKIEVLWGGLPSDPGWGEDGYGKDRFDNDNNHSIVTRVDFGESSLLITGDLEEVAIRELLRRRPETTLDVDIYEVGHHGSANGTTSDLLRAMSPQYAVMEVGDPARRHSWTAWAYGHPRASIIDLLMGGVSGTRDVVNEEIGLGMKSFTTRAITQAIYATGWDGTVILEGDRAGNIVRGTPDLP